MRQPAMKIDPRPELRAGMKVRLGRSRNRWTVRGVTSRGRFAILTQPFNLQHTVLYTVVDFDRGVRGKDDYYGLGYETDEDIAAALHMFQHTEDNELPPGQKAQADCREDWCCGGADVSYRSANHVRLDFQEIDGTPTEWDGHPQTNAA